MIRIFFDWNNFLAKTTETNKTKKKVGISEAKKEANRSIGKRSVFRKRVKESKDSDKDDEVFKDNNEVENVENNDENNALNAQNNSLNENKNEDVIFNEITETSIENENENGINNIDDTLANESFTLSSGNQSLNERNYVNQRFKLLLKENGEYVLVEPKHQNIIRKCSVELERIDLCNFSVNTSSKQLEIIDHDDVSNHTVDTCSTDSVITLNGSDEYEDEKYRQKNSCIIISPSQKNNNANQKFNIGDYSFARWGSDGYYYPAEILNIGENKIYKIKFFDDKSYFVKEKDLVSINELKLNDSVLVKNGNEYNKAYINYIQDQTFIVMLALTEEMQK